MVLVAPPPLLSKSDLETRRGELLQLLADGDVCHNGAQSSEIERLVTSFAKDHRNHNVCIGLEVMLVIQPTLTLSADQPQDLRATVYNIINMYKMPQDMNSIEQ